MFSSRPLLRHATRALVLFCLCLALHAATEPQAAPRAERSQALIELLRSRFGIEADAASVVWGEARGRWCFRCTTQAWLLGREDQGPRDSFSVRARLTPEGQLVQLADVRNLSDTPATDEAVLAGDEHSVAWASGGKDQFYRVTWLQFDRSPLDTAPELSKVARLQWQLTWLQRLGTLNGARQRWFKLIPPSPQLQLEVKDRSLRIRSPNAETLIPYTESASQGGRYVAELPQHLARPSAPLTWAVDRARQSSWFGDTNMQRLKAVSYRVMDQLARYAWFRGKLSEQDTRTTVAPSDGAPVTPNAQTSNPPSPAPTLPPGFPDAGVSAPAPETLPATWPPNDLPPVLSPALADEGHWLKLDGDPFIRHDALGHVPFVTTFLRTDEEREDSRVTLTAWDPAQVELHMQAGTEEPKSATFETGSGLVPREPAELERFVAAFNGGFQSSHGEFGMMVNRTLYLPPRGYAATLAELETGALGFGVWPESDQVPEEIRSFRQNLTPFFLNGKYNPYHRVWWGGVPPGWEDDTRTVRSGLCVTQAKHVVYFYGSKVDPLTLAKAMSVAGCDFAMHLDMNQGHTGLEFYQVAPSAELPPLGLKLDGVWQAEGEVPDAPGYRYRGRRLFRAMQLMNFPRYIQPETRDFFYLLLRPQLPAASAHLPAEERWRTPAGAGSPPWVAQASRYPLTQLPEVRVELLELDGSRITPKSTPNAPIAWATAVVGEQTLWLSNGRLSISPKPPTARSVALFSGESAPTTARAAVGIKPQSNSLVLAELANEAPESEVPEALRKALTDAGTRELFFLPSPLSLRVFGLDLSGHPLDAPFPGFGVERGEPETLRALFPETPIVPPAVWQPHQRRPPKDNP